MNNWEMTREVLLLWEKKKDQKNDNQLRNDTWRVIVMR
jgi:hypothetical protein